MSINQPTPERPNDPFTSQDGARLYALIERYFKDINDRIQSFSGRIASLERLGIDSLEILNGIEIGLSQSRVNRTELEYKEAELELELAEKNLDAIKQKLSIKEGVKNNNISTNERIKAVTAETVSSLEQKRREASSAFLLDLKRGAIKAVVSALAVSATFGFVAFIWWLIQLYLSRGGP